MPISFPPSRLSRDLARELFRTVREFQMLNPDISEKEILSALEILETEAGGNRTKYIRVALFFSILIICILTATLLITFE